jgi:Invasion associated locus B (IalB) protein
MMRVRLTAISCALGLLTILGAQAALAQEKPTLVGSFRDWHVYSMGAGANRLCYALSEPKQKTPGNVRRGDPFVLLSTWPGRKIVNEPSIVNDYTYKTGAKAQIQFGSERFEFFTKTDGDNNGGWMEDPADEKKLVEAMKKGSDMIVSGTSARGTLTKDTYSLAGITAAIDKIGEVCK